MSRRPPPFFGSDWDDWALNDGGPADACGDGDEPQGWAWERERAGLPDLADPSLGPLDLLIAAEEAETGDAA